MPARKYDYAALEALRAVGHTWSEIAYIVSAPNADTLRGMYSVWKSKQAGAANSAKSATNSANSHASANEEVASSTAPADSPHVEAILTEDDVKRITSLEDLIAFFRIDTDKWEVRDFRVNKWEQASKEKLRDRVRITPLYQVRANLVPKIERKIEVVRQICEDMIRDAAEHAPRYAPPVGRPTRGVRDLGEPCLLELAIFDPHFGMLAWRPEVGKSYDIDIAITDYRAAVDKLLSFYAFYNVEKILYIGGNDMLHVDGTAPGTTRGGATTAGTAQDIDGRLAKMFTAVRRALVEGIDKARTIAPVDVLFVPGNHDEQQTYRMGEVISAWYRNDPSVHVIYSPNKRHYYGYGKNALMFTHGEDYKRARDSLPLIFATECPPDIWVASEHREVHTGHNHIKMEGRYTPTSDVAETRGIRTRSLPGLTPEDAWHHKEGYKHRRAATALVFRKSGGIEGLHEFSL